MTNHIEPFETSDVALAAYLKVKKYTISKVVKQTQFKSVFVFQTVPRQEIEDYRNGQALVDPNDFAYAMKQLVRNAKMALRSE